VSNIANTPVRSSFLSSGLVLAALSLVLISGGVLIWNNRQPATDAPGNQPSVEDGSAPITTPRTSRRPPLPIVDEVPNQPSLHGVTYGVENGTAIVKIKVVADGDELIVDANTGRLIESRPSRPSAPPPLGKFAAPFVPMM